MTAVEKSRELLGFSSRWRYKGLKKRKQPNEAAESEEKPVDMTGFALLQTIACPTG
jgi:hypothetical protein